MTVPPHFKRHTSPTVKPLTLDEQIQRLGGFRAAFPDIQITVEEVLDQGAGRGHWLRRVLEGVSDPAEASIPVGVRARVMGL